MWNIFSKTIVNVGQRPHSMLDGSSNYFGIFPAFSGNQNCPPAPTCTTCPAAPPYKEDITSTYSLDIMCIYYAIFSFA